MAEVNKCRSTVASKLVNVAVHVHVDADVVRHVAFEALVNFDSAWTGVSRGRAEAVATGVSTLLLLLLMGDDEDDDDDDVRHFQAG